MLYDTVIVNFLILCIPCIHAGVQLNNYVRHYEPLSYDAKKVHENHIRAKRDVYGDESLHIDFTSHGRAFRLRLKRDTSHFSPDLVVDGPESVQEDIDLSHIYSGKLWGDDESHVFGAVQNGVFDGKIVSASGNFFVEKAKKYFPLNSNNFFHSVIYSEDDVIDPFEDRRKGYHAGCGVTDKIFQEMDRLQRSAVDSPSYYREHAHNDIDNYDESAEDNWDSKGWEKYLPLNHSRGRDKRSFPDFLSKNPKTTCTLYIRTDPLFWARFYKSNHEDVTATRDEIIVLISQHVAALNNIYQNTKFDGKYPHRMMRFEVQRIKIDDDRACKPGWTNKPNEFCRPNIDVSNFLNLQSQEDHESFCLAYLFTYRDFTGGTLGLAWVASPTSAGGICEKYKEYTDRGSTSQKVKRSLNTGIITFVNYNSPVPPKVSHLTLAHEIGHNFGSPHDYPSHCTPGSRDGNYIMFASATSGDKPNNSKFSSCSISNISQVLDAITEKKKYDCFTRNAGAFCGNKIVETGEECDCGYDYKDCTEKCCYPRALAADRRPPPGAEMCKRPPSAQCSPSEGICCASSCTFVSAYEKLKCAEETECALESYCDGTSSTCPKPRPRKDKTKCNGGTQICLNGECSGSYCLIFNMERCFLSSDNVLDKVKLCELACQEPGNSSSCRSTKEMSHLMSIDGPIMLQPGSPCDNYQGYCDVFQKCRAVDAEGPLLRLKNLLFNHKNLTTLKEWVTRYWWAVMLIGVAVIIVMGLFIKCCAVHTPSSNPKAPPHIKIQDTLHHPITTLRRMSHRNRHPHAQQHQHRRSQHAGRYDPQGGHGPPRGYGEGRGQYRRPKGPRGQPAPSRSSGIWPAPDMIDGAYPSGPNVMEMRHQKL